MTATRTLEEANANQRSTRILLSRGSLDIRSLYDPVNNKRIYSVLRRAEFILNCRGHFQKLRETMPEPSPEVNYEALGLIVQPGAHGKPARFKIVTDKSIVCMIMLQFDKRIAMNPSLQSARSLVTPEVMQCVKDGTFTPPAFHALITALATENIPTTLPAGSISQDTAFGAVGGKVFQGEGQLAKAAGEREAEVVTSSPASRPAVLAASLAEAA